MSSLHPDPPGARDRRLSRLLARWADAHRLSDRQADAIRQAVRATPVDLGFAWWWSLLDPVAGSAFRTVSASAGWSILPGAPIPAALTPTLVPRPTARHEPDSEYQAYLRL